jgi:glycosyltransferase involved in cell wall biosynthesis
VANDVPEHREVLADTGVYFEAGRPETLTSALERLLSEPPLAEEYGRRAEARARALYSWSAVTDAYERLLDSLVHPSAVL